MVKKIKVFENMVFLYVFKDSKTQYLRISVVIKEKKDELACLVIITLYNI